MCSHILWTSGSSKFYLKFIFEISRNLERFFIKVWGVRYNPSATNIVSVSEDRSINVYEVPATP